MSEFAYPSADTVRPAYRAHVTRCINAQVRPLSLTQFRVLVRSIVFGA